MRKLLITSILALSCALSAAQGLGGKAGIGGSAGLGGGATVSSGATVVQPTSGSPLNAACAQFTGGTNTCAYPVNVTSGNEAYVLIIAGGAGTIGTPTKSAGTATIGTFTSVAAACATGGEMQVFKAAITGTGSATISETFSTSTNIGVFPFEVSNDGGPDTGTNPVCHTSNPFSTSYVTASVTTATANDVILLARMGGTTQVFTALTPYTLSGQGPGTAGNDTSWFTGNYTSASATTVNGSYTATPGSDTEQDIVVAIK